MLHSDLSYARTIVVLRGFVFLISAMDGGRPTSHLHSRNWWHLFECLWKENISYVLLIYTKIFSDTYGWSFQLCNAVVGMIPLMMFQYKLLNIILCSLNDKIFVCSCKWYGEEICREQNGLYFEYFSTVCD